MIRHPIAGECKRGEQAQGGRKGQVKGDSREEAAAEGGERESGEEGRGVGRKKRIRGGGDKYRGTEREGGRGSGRKAEGPLLRVDPAGRAAAPCTMCEE